VALNFKVTRAFRHEFRMFAAERDEDMIQILYAPFAALKNERAK
jgi:hypothetical protein